MRAVRPDETFRAEVRAWLDAPRARDARPAARPRRANATHFEANRAWQRELFDGGLGRHRLARRVRRPGRDARSGRRYSREEQRRRDGERGVRRVDDRHGRARAPSLRERGATASDTSDRCSAETRRGASSSANRRREAISRTSRRARLHDGDEFVVNGQKVWTSNAHLCDFAILLVRTNLDAPKHRGISFLLLDMHTPGVEVRPLRQITGARAFQRGVPDRRARAGRERRRRDRRRLGGRTGRALARGVGDRRRQRGGHGATQSSSRSHADSIGTTTRSCANGSRRRYASEQILRYMKQRIQESVTRPVAAASRRFGDEGLVVGGAP